MRKFTFKGGTSNKFWEIALDGKRFTVRFGRVGTDGQKQVKTFANEEAAEVAHDKLIAEKLKKGYKETKQKPPKPVPPPSPLRLSLESALAENPDDLASHMAYADYLSEQGDPLGEFVRVQLALEDESRPKAERDALKQQEKALFRKHGKEWLGDLAPIAFKRQNTGWGDLKFEYTFARGWLHTLKAGYYNLEFIRDLAKSPRARLLRHLTLYDNDWEHGDIEPGDGVPAYSVSPALYPLARSPYLTNVRTLVVGELLSPADEDGDVEDGLSCHTEGEGVEVVVKAMPRLEELRVLAHDVDSDTLFSLPLGNLRVLQYYHSRSYPLAKLAKNPSLGQLTHLLLHPHAAEETKAYIREPGVRELVNSPHLKSLTHLQLRLSDMGDKGVKTIIESGILKRLEVLDLRHGKVTDKGARMLAACPDAKHLTRLDLTHNCLDEGEELLKQAGVKVVAERQWTPTGDQFEDQEYLLAGDIE